MDLRVTVVGGTGFIGRRLGGRLVGRGVSVRIVSRRAEHGGPAPQIERVAGSIEDPSTLERAVDGASAVINLVGTTAAKSEQQFYSLHRDRSLDLRLRLIQSDKIARHAQIKLETKIRAKNAVNDFGGIAC